MRLLFTFFLVGSFAFSQEVQELLPNRQNSSLKNQTTTNDMHIFLGFEEWPNSNLAKTEDYFLKMLMYISHKEEVGRRYTLNLDFNGDGLMDFLIHERLRIAEDNVTISFNNYYFIMLNKGNFKFEPGYKCVVTHVVNGNIFTWYGDCAAESNKSSGGN